MVWRFLAVSLVFCGLAATQAAAKPRTVPDTVTEVADGEFTLATLGPARLAGLQRLDAARLRAQLSPGAAVEAKRLGADRYGRSTVILYRPGQKESLQETLLREGAAVAYDRHALPASWMQAEAAARASRVGLWGSDAILGPQQASQHLGEFVLVEGVVTHRFQSRQMDYINFGEDWKTDFSLRIPRKAWRGFGKDFALAEGTRVRARGTLFAQNGPMIELTRPQQLEVVHADAQ